ncbi:MAG: LysM peptidoglycan-binding domain-containing protein [Desulfobulbaceae bacterium]|nr:LysM peptidoglycan-binding domain-containing protein [Desulfobulbaceae bacterium]
MTLQLHKVQLLQQKIISVVVLTLLFTSAICCTPSFAGNKPFPLYHVITDNVSFWEKIYSTYSLNQAVIHDSKDLSKIYEVITLLDQKQAEANRLNSIKQKQARKKYQVMLKKLGKHAPVSKEEKRIAALFAGKNKRRAMAKAADTVRSQSGQKERFREGVIKSGAYMKEIKRIFRSYRLPEDLSYLPHVESSFNTRAYSKFGAAGIWQFTRSTGKQYLKISYTVDERLDPILASHAAAKYLKNSYRNLVHWPLAVTSYNYGLSGTLRGQKKFGSYSRIFKKYNDGHFKFASRNFYSEFLAALKVAKKIEKKIQLAQIQSSHQIKLKGYVHIKDIRRHFNLNNIAIKELNPALRPPVFSGEKLLPKGYILRLPKGDKTSSRVASIPPSIFKKKQKSSLFHRVKKGETAGSIARLHGISLNKLMKTNNLDQFATIYIRQKLRILTTSAKHTAQNSIPKLSARSKNKQEPIDTSQPLHVLTASKKNRPLEKKLPFLPPKDPTVYNVFNIKNKNGKPSGQVTVQPEESLGLYADWLGTSRLELAKFNGFKSTSQISPGQRLSLPFDLIKPELFEDRRLDFLQETEDDFFSAYIVVGQKKYHVNSGDTLWNLCYNKFDIPLWLLERYNSTIDLARLQNKQELIIPIVQQI